MPIPFVTAVNRAARVRTDGSDQAQVPARTRRAPSSRLRIIGWIVALVAIFAMFMGGAGVVMLLAGHVTTTAVALTIGGVVGGVYLVVFLAYDSRTNRRPAPTPRRRRVTTPSTGTCSFCGLSVSGERSLLRSPRATICHRCIDYARTITAPDPEES